MVATYRLQKILVAGIQCRRRMAAAYLLRIRLQMLVARTKL